MTGNVPERWRDFLDQEVTTLDLRNRICGVDEEVVLSGLKIGAGFSLNGLSSYCSRREKSTLSLALSVGAVLVPELIDVGWKAFKSLKTIPQCEFFDGEVGDVDGEGFTMLCDKKLARKGTYTFRYRDSGEQCTITGIACVPLSAEIQSPAAEVVRGGVGNSFADISLTPQEEGPFACRVIIAGKKGQPPVQQRSDAPVLRESEAIPQCEFIDGCPETGTVVLKQRFSRWSHKPHTISYSDPTNIITGIACVPMDTKTQSPETELIEGGVNCNHVVIRLTPVETGKWGCDVTIRVTPSTDNVDG